MSKLTPFLLSVFDLTGNWSQPYIDAGWRVLRWDKQIEGCVLENFSYIHMLIEEETGGKIDGLLAAPPCTAYSASGARWWPEKDKKTSSYSPFASFTEYMVALTLIILHAVDVFNPDFWALENPVGRIESLVPELKKYRLMTFQPCDYGDPYTKKTVLYGQFNPDLPRAVVTPVLGSKMRDIPPGSNRKNIRSETPQGFADAFFRANQKKSLVQTELFG